MSILALYTPPQIKEERTTEKQKYKKQSKEYYICKLSCNEI